MQLGQVNNSGSYKVLEKLFIKNPYDPKAQRVVTRMWTRVKSGT